MKILGQDGDLGLRSVQEFFVPGHLNGLQLAFVGFLGVVL